MQKSDRGPTNPLLASLITDLKIASKENEAAIWRTIADQLFKPRRQRPEVNISKINRHTSSDETVVVAGKVLAAGELQHPVSVAAVNFSSRAREKIEDADGRAFSIRELVDENPTGSGVKIIA